MNKNNFAAGMTFLRKTTKNGGELEMFTSEHTKGEKCTALFSNTVGAGEEVIVIGAGVAGLCIAYELLKHTQYKVTVLEAQNRVGGRSLTVRPGDSFTENPENKPDTSYTQTCEFAVEDVYNKPYLNCGPGRIPSAHRDVLNYCKALGVKLEVYVMQSRSNVLYDGKSFVDDDDNPTTIVNRRLANDPRGYFAQFLYALPELLKIIEESTDPTKYKDFLEFVAPLKNALDANDESDNTAKFKAWLKKFGDLSESGFFEKTARSGYTKLPTKDISGEEENIMPKLDFTKMLASEFWNLSFYQPDDFWWQQTSFQPVGGMDMFVKTLAAEVQKLGGTILLNAAVQKISRESDRYRVYYHCGDTVVSKTARKCFSNMPIPLLQDKITPGLFKSAAFEQALNIVFEHKDFLRPTVKVGWQSERKYWQDPEDENTIPIFGGISWTKHPMVQMWYPSNDYHQDLGVLTGAYNFSDNATKWGDQTPQWRLDQARAGAALLHGDEFAEQLKHGLTVAWQNVKTQRGGWVDWTKIDKKTKHLKFHDILKHRRKPENILNFAEQADSESAEWVYHTLQDGDDGFYIVGDQLSALPGWQEGAVASALVAFGLCVKMKGFSAPKLRQVPFTAQLVEGR